MPFVNCPSLPKTCQTILVFYTTNNVNHNFAKYVKIHVAQIFVKQYFFPTFFCPRSWTFLLLEGYIMGLHGDVFPSWDSNLSSLVLMGVFLIHLAVQVQAISCTPLSPGWAPAVNLVLWYHCWITTWESDPPE